MQTTTRHILASLVALFALTVPRVAGAAQSGPQAESGNSISSGGALRGGSTRTTPVGHMRGDSAEERSLSWSEKLAGRSQDPGGNAPGSSPVSHSSRWTVFAETIVFDRAGTSNRTLIERVPGSVPFMNVPATPGTPALDSTQLNQGFSPGFRTGMTYRLDSNYGVELSFFRVGGWDAARSVGPDDPPNWLVMRAPGNFWQTQDFSYQSMNWDYSTKLYNAEVDVRRHLSRRMSLLAGFRWLELRENLVGTIPPPDRILPTWKYNPANTLFDVARIENQPGGTPATGAFPPFWASSTSNNLYGFQFGVDGTLFDQGRFSIAALTKAGGYWNRASQSTGVSLAKVVYPSDASTGHAAFVAELGLRCTFQVSSNLSLRFGYEALALEGVALAPGQIKETSTSGLTAVNALGIDVSSGVLFHGATAGMRVSF